jgi:hypothetical protein
MRTIIQQLMTEIDAAIVPGGMSKHEAYETLIELIDQAVERMQTLAVELAKTDD